MSKLNRSLALEEIKGSDSDLEELLLVRYLSVSSTSTESQPVCQVVTVEWNYYGFFLRGKKKHGDYLMIVAFLQGYFWKS